MEKLSHQQTQAAQWAGAVFALLVLTPVILIPEFGGPERLLAFRYSLWALLPVFGGALGGWLLGRRFPALLAGGLAGYSAFWCAATWGAGSAATSIYESLAAAGVGVLPVVVLYGLGRRLARWSEGLPRQSAGPIHKGPGALTFGEVIRAHWGKALFFGGAFLILSVMTILDLNALENGSVPEVSAWKPIASFYERFGYWPAVLLVPVLGIVCGWAICWKVMRDGHLDE